MLVIIMHTDIVSEESSVILYVWYRIFPSISTKFLQHIFPSILTKFLQQMCYTVLYFYLWWMTWAASQILLTCRHEIMTYERSRQWTFWSCTLSDIKHMWHKLFVRGKKETFLFFPPTISSHETNTVPGVAIHFLYCALWHDLVNIFSCCTVCV